MTVSRFAPSPTGLLHLGHAYSAWLAGRLATRLLLRIEDIDQGRCREAFVSAILEDLSWLGIAVDQDIWRQSARLPVYAQALDRLTAERLVYPCFCTRKEIAEEIARAPSAPHGPDGPLYPGTCRNLDTADAAARIAAGQAHAWRLDMAKALAAAPRPLSWIDRKAGPQNADPARFGDIVLGRKDIATSYHLAVVIDDAAQGVELVVRGQDLFEATHVHRLLQALLGLPAPAYHHHGLITDAAGRRLAKRDKAETLQAMRAAGNTPSAVRHRLQRAAQTLGDL